MFEAGEDPDVLKAENSVDTHQNTTFDAKVNTFKTICSILASLQNCCFAAGNDRAIKRDSDQTRLAHAVAQE